MTEFDDLYNRYAQHVHRFALFLCGDPTLAEDITSETFVRAWTGRGKIQMPTVKSYLFAIARNLYRDALGQNLRQTVLDDANSTADPHASPQSRLEQRSELEAVLAELSGFSEIDRAALLLRVQEEMSYEEIAQTLAITPASAKVKVHRARLRLMRARTALQEVHS